MKVCSSCNVSKDLDDFHKNKNAADGRQSRCKVCAIAIRKKYYRENHAVERERMNAASRAVYSRNRKRLDEILQGSPCVDCGESDPIVLEFDHVRGIKVAPVTSLLRSTVWDVIQEEIDKCEVRCCSCHRKRHYQARSSIGQDARFSPL